MERHERHHLLTLADADLLKVCRVDVFRGSGRGGQKRNTTDSAVRVTHAATRVQAVSDETRSQSTNKHLALRRLRRNLALVLRVSPAKPWSGTWAPAPRNPLHAPWLATILDALHDCEYRIGDAARLLEVSTGRLSRELKKDGQLWQHLNRCRQQRGLAPLRAG